MAKDNSFNASNILIIFTIIFELMFSAFAVINPFFAENIAGTKWCGSPNTAKDYDDLGIHRETDICCRNHNHCDDYILPNEDKYGLHNNYTYPRLNCKCENELLDCLHKVDSEASKLIGFAYFKFASECFKEENPIIGCEKPGYSFFGIRCNKYILNMTEPKKYQWFDLPVYHPKKFEV